MSTEKGSRIPRRWVRFKTGHRVWSIDRIEAASIEALDNGMTEVQSSGDGATLHVKDRCLRFAGRRNGTDVFSHPFGWSSSNAAWPARRGGGEFVLQKRSVLERGATWDVAWRVTDRLAVPQVGLLAGLPPLSLFSMGQSACARSMRTRRQSSAARLFLRRLGGLA